MKIVINSNIPNLKQELEQFILINRDDNINQTKFKIVQKDKKTQKDKNVDSSCHLKKEKDGNVLPSR